MNWFYDYTIDIYTYSDDNYDENGVSIDGYSKKMTINCDIQPTGTEKIKKAYGYDLEANFEVYSDEELNESDIILWNNKTYKIQKVIPWNDYSISFIKQEVVEIDG